MEKQQKHSLFPASQKQGFSAFCCGTSYQTEYIWVLEVRSEKTRRKSFHFSLTFLTNVYMKLWFADTEWLSKPNKSGLCVLKQIAEFFDNIPGQSILHENVSSSSSSLYCCFNKAGCDLLGELPVPELPLPVKPKETEEGLSWAS